MANMDLHNLLAQIRDVYVSERPIAFYVAAGISYDCPSHLPLGGQLKEAVLAGFLEMEKHRDLTLIKETVVKRSLEEVCGVVQNEIEDKKQLIRTMSQALESDDVIPNQIHRFMARALHDGHLVVTTNYEGLIEQAYKTIYKARFPSARVCYDDDTFTNFLAQSPSPAFERRAGEPGWLLKLHGSFRSDGRDTSQSVMTTFDRVGRGLPSNAQEVLIQILKACPMVVMGYGCMDIDIVYPVLMETLSSQPIWWVRHKDGLGISEYDQVQHRLEEEESKKIETADVQMLNICRVLISRGKENGGKVWLIDSLTSQVILLLMGQIGGKFGATSKSCRVGKGEPRWKRVLLQLGMRASSYERLYILGKLAQICAPYRSGDQDIYDLSDSLFEAASGETGDPSKIALYISEVGWNTYRRAPEANAEKALNLYEKSKEAVPQASLLDQLMIPALRALALRRSRRIIEALNSAESVWNLLPEQIRIGNLPSDPKDVRFFMQGLGLPETDWGKLGSLLRRIAGVYDQCVSGPEALASAIRCQYHWTMDEQELRLLERARRLLELDRCLQQLVGERKEKIQSENQLGLVCSKVGYAQAAKEAHKESRRVASQFGWWYEYAQATRNLALAQEAAHDFGAAICTLEDAAHMFEQQQRPGDLNSVLWHLGRIRIKRGDATGIGDIEKHLLVGRDWHEKANDYVLLSIGYYDILGNAAAGKQHLTDMLNQYPADDVIKNRAYGVDNALANVIAALERLHKDTSPEAGELREKFNSLRQRLERLRFEAVQSLPALS